MNKFFSYRARRFEKYSFEKNAVSLVTSKFNACSEQFQRHIIVLRQPRRTHFKKINFQNFTCFSPLNDHFIRSPVTTFPVTRTSCHFSKFNKKISNEILDMKFYKKNVLTIVKFSIITEISLHILTESFYNISKTIKYFLVKIISELKLRAPMQ